MDRKAFSQIVDENLLSGLEGGQLSPQKLAADQWVLLRTWGVARSMELDETIEPVKRELISGTVFSGTSVPIRLLFEFLEDDQTMDTFLDQFPMVSRDQARAVLGASRDMLLTAAGSEI